MRGADGSLDKREGNRVNRFISLCTDVVQGGDVQGLRCGVGLCNRVSKIDGSQ
jgi:hypothetical protein